MFSKKRREELKAKALEKKAQEDALAKVQEQEKEEDNNKIYLYAGVVAVLGAIIILYKTRKK